MNEKFEFDQLGFWNALKNPYKSYLPQELGSPTSMNNQGMMNFDYNMH